MLDASAVLAGLNGEPGSHRLEAALDAAVVCSVNLAEVAWGLVRGGNSQTQARAVIRALSCTTIVADEELALEAGFMRSVTDRAGLSLGDRFCLALARRLRAPALTTDRQWLKVADDLGVEVDLLR